MTPALLLVLSLPGIAAGLQDADVPLWPRAVSNATVLSPISTPAVTGTGTAGIHASHNCSWSWSSWLDKSFDHKGSMGFQNITTTYSEQNFETPSTRSRHPLMPHDLNSISQRHCEHHRRLRQHHTHHR